MKGHRNNTQCRVCSWVDVKFTEHILNSQDENHKEWKQNLIDSYHKTKSAQKVSEQFKITLTLTKKILRGLNVLKIKNKARVLKCPFCDWESAYYFPEHIRDSNDEAHDKFKQDIVDRYLNKKMSPKMISVEYEINNIQFIVEILKFLNVKVRNHHEAVVNAIQQNRHNINTYGIGGFRKDLNGHFRSIPEANFARILKLKNIEYKKEVAFDLYDENKNLLTTYFMDFLISDNQGFEIKGYGNDYEFKNKEKVVLFTKQYPHIKLKVIYCSSQEWKDIEKKYASLIPLWETQSRNLRTNPEIYSI